MSERYAPYLAPAMVAAGIWMLFFQQRFQTWMRRRHQARLADRHARGRDAYFEELRALEAYPPEAVSPPIQRVFGALSIILGASYLALSLTR